MRWRVSKLQADVALTAQIAQADKKVGDKQAIISATSQTSHSSSSTVTEKTAAAHFAILGCKELKTRGDNALLELLSAAELPPHLLDYKKFTNYSLTLNPLYNVPSRTMFNNTLLPRQQAFVQNAQLEFLRTQLNLTISFDGDATRCCHNFYTTHANTADDWAYLLEMMDDRGVSHTAT